MKLQTKFNLGIIIIFVLLAIAIVVMSVNYVNANTIREAENRVRIYARAAWEILDSKTERVRTASEILSQDQSVKNLFQDPEDEDALMAIREYLEAIRQEEGMDILNVLTPGGTVILRTRAPYNNGDSLIDDPMVRQVMQTRQSNSGYIILKLERMDIEGTGLFERCMAVGGEPRGMLAGAAVPVMNGGELVGIIQMGALLNGASEKVDRIRDAVFENEYYTGKPVGTTTIFMGDLRISTNVMDSQSRRAVGTRVSKEVADQVLTEGASWTGRAFVVDTWYLSQYDPIKDPDGAIIGMLYVGELEQKYLDIRTRAVMQFLGLVFAGMAAAFLTFFFLVRSVLHPIRMLSDATHRITSGNLGYRIRGLPGKDEISDLTTSFNNMAEQLERQRQEIEQRQRELEKISEELHITNQNYIDMLGFVAHELKNPLSSATLSLYTVKDGYLGKLTSVQEKSLDAVARSLHYFNDMVKNYLDLSRMEKGELEVNKEPIPIYSQVVAPIVSGLDQELRECRMIVENRIPKNLTLNVDGNLLKIVFDNLFSNAVKYGKKGGSIVLDAKPEGKKRVIFSVQNDGVGIPPEKVPLLFRKFSRLDSPECAGVKGTGLGLFICKEIIEKHSGEIWVESELGQWVRFSFTLPKD